MTKTFANGRTIVHQRDGLADIAGPPDVCKTPTPAGPVPVPYVNVARSIDLAQGARRTRIAGAPIAHAASFIATSTGDEPGTAGGGVISSRIRGKLRWLSTSLDVRVEGKGVARFSDAVGHNGNTFNTAFTQVGGTGWAYGDDSTEPCPICQQGPERHRVHETADSHRRARQLYDALQQAYGEYQANLTEQNRLATEVDRLKADKQAYENGLDAAPGSSSQADPFADPPEAGPSNPRPTRTKEQKKQLKEHDKGIRAVATEMRALGEANGKAAVHKRTTPHGGYMIGVMVCKSNQIFAAMSGQTLPGFKKVVAELGWTLCDDESTVAEYAAANPAVTPANQQALQDRWDDAQRRNDNGEPHYNPRASAPPPSSSPATSSTSPRRSPRCSSRLSSPTRSTSATAISTSGTPCAWRSTI
ncbi:DUF4150 domain-containing protein [Nannocystis pusilla]|uniref:DUF4150 domain-containing protein n=1 Tax=Nannocystis pusilla TaxID=889268 RepID=A0A9X3F0Z3_9BACT|nr:DUF4150 domain-containing protein [Nannocystis pusilla]MCY1009438.1 DUF4150 domain-containing protein [Nannocystis pusilla]